MLMNLLNLNFWKAFAYYFLMNIFKRFLFLYSDKNLQFSTDDFIFVKRFSFYMGIQEEKKLIGRIYDRKTTVK